MRTNVGADFQAAQIGGTTPSANGANYIALTANNAAPVATDTTLTGEITTAGGGLVRKQATYAHTAGTTNYTLTATFTANASDTLPVTITKIGVFTAGAGGTMMFESLLTNSVTLNSVGDSITVTETVSI